jgi:hypothetical protein
MPVGTEADGLTDPLRGAAKSIDFCTCPAGRS